MLVDHEIVPQDLKTVMPSMGVHFVKGTLNRILGYFLSQTKTYFDARQYILQKDNSALRVFSIYVFLNISVAQLVPRLELPIVFSSFLDCIICQMYHFAPISQRELA